MEIYFNPYPGAAKTEEEGLRCIIDVADAFVRMKKTLQTVQLSGKFSIDEIPPSKFVLIRNPNIELGIKDIFHKVTSQDRIKIQLLLETFSKGRVMDEKDIGKVENWIITNIGLPVPVLELAARNRAITLTIPTESEWCFDVLNFENRSEILHNLWGQEDISGLTAHCIDTLKNAMERFSVCFKADFCGAALNDAPPSVEWDNSGFFATMERAQNRHYEIDDNLIKNVAETKHGPLRELRIYGPGHRIFFVYRKEKLPEILVGGFYQKNQGVNQNQAIENARKRINEYQVSGDV